MCMCMCMCMCVCVCVCVCMCVCVCVCVCMCVCVCQMRNAHLLDASSSYLASCSAAGVAQVGLGEGVRRRLRLRTDNHKREVCLRECGKCEGGEPLATSRCKGTVFDSVRALTCERCGLPVRLHALRLLRRFILCAAVTQPLGCGCVVPVPVNHTVRRSTSESAVIVLAKARFARRCL